MSKRKRKNDSQRVMEVFDEVQTKDQPFLAKDNKGKVVLRGDATKTTAKTDYIVRFIYPIDMADEFDDYADNENGTITVERKIKKVFLTQAVIGNILKPASEIMLKLVQYNELKTEDEHSFEKLLRHNAIVDRKFMKDVREIVQEVLKIDDEDIDYIELANLFEVVFEIILENSSFFQSNNI